MPRSSSAVAKRYARALFDIGAAEDRTKTLQELHAFVEMMKHSKEVTAFFVNPVLKPEEKKTVLESVKDKFPLSIRFLETLVEAERMEILDEIADEFERLSEESSGELSVRLETATPIPENLQDVIKNLLQEKWKRQIRLSTSINPQLIGGFVARAPGRIFDASVVAQLEAMEQQIAG